MINDAIVRLQKMGLDDLTAKQLLSFKDNENFLYDSAFKITDLFEDRFVEAVKDIFLESTARDIYQKAVARKKFISIYMANARNISEPHYRAQRCCNIH
ncbi:MAG: hypothetical protein O7150_06405 [Wolbachia endosymbiont of Andrena praecox]|uniref:hypothetical protein n=1 Tax=unclassified Wolbachia TaxID=2640676 RepID=UPI0007EEC08A|nr:MULTISPECIES: hypothetical protein [unclassified Wolbachia]MDX5488375.1 hypothetical protein [Wolbachia endosymbiont of Andrena praecox]MDX5543770.1 hypothetical protein [Wolbachia endosymbiont of Andrena apicata]